MTLAEVCDELEGAIEHERSEVRDWWTMQRLLRALVALGDMLSKHGPRGGSRWDELKNPYRPSPETRFARLKAKAQEVLGG